MVTWKQIQRMEENIKRLRDETNKKGLIVYKLSPSEIEKLIKANYKTKK